MIKKFIPDTITSMNLLCGVVGIVFSFAGRNDLAFLFMIGGAVFDFFDGFAARALGAYSDIGKELDSLADVITFGVLPSVMLRNMMLSCMFGQSVWAWVPLLIAVFSAVRLAKFNVDERQHSSFIGLPTPACAIICGSLCYFVAHDPASFMCAWVAGPVFVPVLSICLSALLVCEVPMFSMKFGKNDSPVLKKKRLMFLLNALICALIAVIVHFNWSIAVLLTFTVYVLMNLVFAIVEKDEN